MSFIATLLTGFPYPLPPTLPGWGVWLALLGLVLFTLYYWRGSQPAWDRRSWLILFGLLLLVPLTSLFVGLRLPAGSALPLPNFPAAHSPGSTMMLFSAVPWTLAGGLLGPLGGAVLGLLAGVLRGAWDTFNLFTPLELALIGTLFSAGLRQNYRTPAFSLLRQPLVSALLLVPLHTILYVIGIFFTLGEPTPVTARLDFALSNTGVVTLAFGGEMLVAGLVAQIAAAAFPSAWVAQRPLQPSPAERSLETRFLLGTGTFICLLLLTLLVGDWVVAGRAATGMLRERLETSSQSAAQNVPYFLETGQNLATQAAADPQLLEAFDPELSSIVTRRMQTTPYFDEIFVLETGSGALLGAYPAEARAAFALAPEEESGLALAVEGVLTQIYTVPAAQDGGSARVSFLVAVPDDSAQVRRILIGRTRLDTNPLTGPLLANLQSISDLEGTGLLLDENGRVLYSSSVLGTSAAFSDPPSAGPQFYTAAAADGTRQLVYYQPVSGRPWTVVLMVPARQAQQLSLAIATPLSIMIFVLALVALVSLRLGLRVVTGSLQGLALEADRIAQGRLDHPLQAEGVDELGQLRRAFEQMRHSLRARLDELNRLLVVSQGVASSLEMREALRPVLEAVLASGANSARVVLSPAILPETPIELPSRFALGPGMNLYAHLDERILPLAEKQERLVISNPSRMRDLAFEPQRPQPASLLAVALRHESRYYGVMWAAYEKPRTFTDSDVRFMTTLAGQAALAVANAHLFLSVEVGRRQLEAILNSTPDPVLVTDPRDHLLLANRAAGQALGVDLGQISGRPIGEALQQKPLLELLQAASEKTSAELVLPDGKTYLATASSVMAEGLPVGRVCILRDVTYFKELDTMKSEFVATVSHDLRSPLTLMRGYATMLEMVGELNDQQKGYVRKMISGVENMSRLVTNLLDLGRIEIGVGLQLEDVPVIDILERVMGGLQMQAAQKDIALSLQIARDIPHVLQADQALLHQAVYNLVENAVKYTPEGGRVTLRAGTAPGSLLFAIEDTGIGIAADDLPRLFEKFYRGKQREARAQHGSGLGLAIVRSIAESHGGRVWVESKAGAGSTFFLQIPLTQASAGPPA